MSYHLTDESEMPFGIHKGKKLANVPASYLLWLWDNNKCNIGLKAYIKDNLDVLKEEVKRNAKD